MITLIAVFEMPPKAVKQFIIDWKKDKDLMLHQPGFSDGALYHEWNNKAAGFVGYGGAGGTRAVENLRLIMGELQVADVRSQVMLSLLTDFENFTVFKPQPRNEKSVNEMLDQVIAWGGALKTLREKS